MASAYPNFDDISEKSESSEACVEPKDKPKQATDQLNEIKSEIKPDVTRDKAYIPDKLPKDFLRVMLNEQQVNETTDEELARRLQFGVPRQSRPHQNQAHFRGRLQIEILEAQLNKNYGLVKMDPYVKVTIASKVYETPTDYSGGKNPRWFKTIMCYIPHSVDMIKFEVFDEKSFTEDEMIAVVKFPLPESLFKDGICEEWLPLSGKLGEQKEGSISIRINFMSLQNIQQSQGSNPYNAEIQGLYPYPPQRINAPELTQRQLLEEDLQLDTALRLSTAESASRATYSEEDLKNIQEMFPSFDMEIIKSTLEASSGNKESAIENLLQMSG